MNGEPPTPPEASAASGVEVRVHRADGSAAAPGDSDLFDLLERAVRRTFADGEAAGRSVPNEEAVVGVLDAETGGGAVLDASAAGELSVALVDDPDIRRLNREHLGHDRVTDVIAFPLWERGEPVVGDVYVGLEQARRQAAVEGVPLEEELVRLVVHGTLHVLGWDHPEAASEREASPMYRRQERIVRAVVGEAGRST